MKRDDFNNFARKTGMKQDFPGQTEMKVPEILNRRVAGLIKRPRAFHKDTSQFLSSLTLTVTAIVYVCPGLLLPLENDPKCSSFTQVM